MGLIVPRRSCRSGLRTGTGRRSRTARSPSRLPTSGRRPAVSTARGHESRERGNSARCGRIGYGAAHAPAPRPRAGAPHIEGSSRGETTSPANRRFDRDFDRAPRYVPAHRLRLRLARADADPARTGQPAPAGRPAAPAGRRAPAARSGCSCRSTRAASRRSATTPSATEHSRSSRSAARRTRACSAASPASSSAAAGTASPTTCSAATRARDGGARRRGRAGHGRLLARRRDDRRHHCL